MKVAFLSPLHVEKLEGDMWRVLTRFRARVTHSSRASIEVRVEPGTLTDFASVPRLPLAYLLAGNTAHRAALLHDTLYNRRESRFYADLVFLEGMKTEGVCFFRRWAMFLAVRLFGWLAYRRKAGAQGAY